jgi:branched-chain amino acid transport system ATP-binding protein
MLEINDLSSYYGGAHVLRGVSLTVPDGKVVTLLGRNGMGKTTLIRSIMGTTPPNVRGGSIRYNGTELIGKAPHDIARLGLGLVPQGRRVFPSLSVSEHLIIAARPPRHAPAYGQAGTRIHWTLAEIWKMFPRLADRKGHGGNQLSGGERQMLAIARALMTNPDLILMDEPSEGLAPVMVQQLRRDFTALKASGVPLFLVEQNVGLALSVADEVYILERGQVVYHGSPEEVAASREIKVKYLGVA